MVAAGGASAEANALRAAVTGIAANEVTGIAGGEESGVVREDVEQITGADAADAADAAGARCEAGWGWEVPFCEEPDPPVVTPALKVGDRARADGGGGGSSGPKVVAGGVAPIGTGAVPAGRPETGPSEFDFGTVVVDPPRAGLDPKTLALVRAPVGLK